MSESNKSVFFAEAAYFYLEDIQSITWDPTRDLYRVCILSQEAQLVSEGLGDLLLSALREYRSVA